MHTVRTTLTTTANPLALVVLVWALVWGFGATQVTTVPAGPDAAQGDSAAGSLGAVESDTLWQSSWSERFPGCVALALWPRDERPVALVTRGAGGEVARVSPEARSLDRVVGACR